VILPTIRASIGRRDALHLVHLLSQGDAELRQGALRRLEERGLDALLDDPRILNALLTRPGASVPPAVVFYVLVRHALLEMGIDELATADYVASLVVRFGHGSRAYRVSASTPEQYHYLVDIVAQIQDADSRRAFRLRVHLGDFSLWISGLFPDYVEARVRRRAAPSIRYYEDMGSASYRAAARSREAEWMGLDDVLRSVGKHFRGVRSALNLVSERYLWPRGGDPVDRLLREVSRGSGG
jgi:hypothetical protein